MSESGQTARKHSKEYEAALRWAEGEESPRTPSRRVRIGDPCLLLGNAWPKFDGGVQEICSFTLPDNQGGSVEDLEEFWANDTPQETTAALKRYNSVATFEPYEDFGKLCGEKSNQQVASNNARAVHEGLQANLNDEQWEKILDGFERRCAYCGIHGKMCIEHVNPLSRGGGTTKENIVPACADCNSKKSTRTPKEWLSPEKYRSFSVRHEVVLRKAFE